MGNNQLQFGYLTLSKRMKKSIKEISKYWQSKDNVLSEMFCFPNSILPICIPVSKKTTSWLKFFSTLSVFKSSETLFIKSVSLNCDTNAKR